MESCRLAVVGSVVSPQKTENREDSAPLSVLIRASSWNSPGLDQSARLYSRTALPWVTRSSTRSTPLFSTDTVPPSDSGTQS